MITGIEEGRHGEEKRLLEKRESRFTHCLFCIKINESTILLSPLCALHDYEATI